MKRMTGNGKKMEEMKDKNGGYLTRGRNYSETAGARAYNGTAWGQRGNKTEKQHTQVADQQGTQGRTRQGRRQECPRVGSSGWTRGRSTGA